MALVVFSGAFYGNFAFFREQACTTVCPYGRLQSTMLDENTMVVAYDYKRGEKRGPLHRGRHRLEASGQANEARFGLGAGLAPGVSSGQAIEIDGMAVAIERLGYRGLPTAGVIEDTGRLTYIDGCSDTILVSPPRQGDPVFNFLHFPPGIQQTVHSHPSIRLGVVARGEGHAFGPARADGRHGAQWQQPLRPGAVFLLQPHELHAFRTTGDGGEQDGNEHGMDVIAYHPDSDWGPTDGVHPMLNRTYRGA